jgi:peptidoglycan/xylan/chitin deacetylase (PgdA/CDA1 family)
MFDTYKSQILGLYYLATLPQRRQAAEERRSNGTVPIMSLLYHRVADTHPNSWTIDRDRFRYQMDWLKNNFELVTLSEAQRRIAAGKNIRPTLCVTFDDGYAENCDFAIPWLIENQIPVTYFVTTDNILTGSPFPHDVERGHSLPPNTVEEIQQMAAEGIEIGAHSRTHADLGANLTDDELRSEITGSKRDLEAILGRPVNYFAFPYGLHQNMTTAGFRIAYEAGFAGVCSAYGAYNMPGDDSFHIQRIHGDPQWSRFINWLTVDPRKLHKQVSFDPGNFRSQVVPGIDSTSGKVVSH